MSIRTIIVEDEPLARGRLRGLLEGDSEIQVIAECGDGRTAATQILELRPDLVFLDIRLPEMDGFEVLSAIGKDNLPAVVFVTAYDKFALQAFEVHAVDYLLKPFDRDRFTSALQRAKDRIASRRTSGKSEALLEVLAKLRPAAAEPARITIKSGGKVTFLKPAEIDWVEAADNYANVHTTSGEHTVRETLSSLAARLPPDTFLRISRSCIVNANRVKEMQPTPHGDYAIILENGTRLTLSRSYRENLSKLRGDATP